MTKSVSIVLPALDTRPLFEVNLPPLFQELERRGLDDEVIVVDDSGRDSAAAWLHEHFPGVRTLAHESNSGFARALRTGVEGAKNDLVFSMNTDVRVRPNFLEPLAEVLADEDVAAVSPRVLLNGREDTFESDTHFGFEDGSLRLERRAGYPEEPDAKRETARAVPFAVGGTMMFRRAEFLARGFDPLFEPFYLEDVDWCFDAWARGRRIIVQPASVVEHNHRGTIGALVEPEVVRAAIERNRLLFLWKNLDDDEYLEEHLLALSRTAANAWLCEEREPLIWLLLALEKRAAALEARAKRPKGLRSFGEILEMVSR